MGPPLMLRDTSFWDDCKPDCCSCSVTNDKKGKEASEEICGFPARKTNYNSLIRRVCDTQSCLRISCAIFNLEKT